MVRAITVAIAYQLAWFATAHGAAQGVPSLGIAACAAVLALAVIVADDRGCVVLLALAAGLYGFVIESALRVSGLVIYNSAGPVAVAAPLWIVALWMAFGALIPLSMTWLQGRVALAAVFGAIMAPLSYVAATQFDALQLASPVWLALTAIAVAWAVAMPSALWLSARLSRGSVDRR